MGEKVGPPMSRRAFLGLVFPELRYVEEAIEQKTWKPDLDTTTKAGFAIRAGLLLNACGIDPTAIPEEPQEEKAGDKPTAYVPVDSDSKVEEEVSALDQDRLAFAALLAGVPADA